MPALPAEVARRHLANARVGYLATASPEAVPHVVPLTFALSDDALYSAVDDKPKRSSRLRRLDNVASNAAVSVLVDGWDEDWTRLWWVRADGRGRVLDGGAEHAAAIAALRAKYPQYADHTLVGAVLAVDLDRITGWTATPATFGHEPATGADS